MVSAPARGTQVAPEPLSHGLTGTPSAADELVEVTICE
jgi:hypothetical protein